MSNIHLGHHMCLWCRADLQAGSGTWAFPSLPPPPQIYLIQQPLHSVWDLCSMELSGAVAMLHMVPTSAGLRCMWWLPQQICDCIARAACSRQMGTRTAHGTCECSMGAAYTLHPRVCIQSGVMESSWGCQCRQHGCCSSCTVLHTVPIPAILGSALYAAQVPDWLRKRLDQVCWGSRSGKRRGSMGSIQPTDWPHDTHLAYRTR